jgi:hypothetical protein
MSITLCFNGEELGYLDVDNQFRSSVFAGLYEFCILNLTNNILQKLSAIVIPRSLFTCTTASAPGGTGAPVLMRAHSPGLTIRADEPSPADAPAARTRRCPEPSLLTTAYLLLNKEFVIRFFNW